MGFFDFLRNRRPARASRAASPARPQLYLEGLESRVVPYSASGAAWAAPNLVTISFVPDGTVLGSNSNGYIYSNMFATFNAKFGAPSVWENQILKAAQQWAQQTNLNFTVVADDGSDIGSGNYQQGAPNFGDIRIGGYNFGTSTLAQAYMPPPINNFSLGGDIQFNTGRSFSIGTGGYDLATVAMHELGHALGLYHSGYSSAVMYANYTAIKPALTTDDINGIRSIYSGGQARTPDTFNGGSGTQDLVGGVLSTVTAPSNNNGNNGGLLGGVLGLLGGLLGGGGSSQTPNDNSFANAANLSSYLDPTLMTGALTGLNLTTPGETEYYAVTAPQGTSGTLTLDVQSSGLSLLNPNVTVYAADQQTVLASASGSGELGSTLMLSVPNVTPGQILYVKVTGADSTAFSTGAYGLSLDFASPGSLPAVPLPNTQSLNGNPLQSGGGQAMNELSAESLANAVTYGDQTTQGPQQVGMDANGNTVAVWTSQNEDGSGLGVYGQRYTATGAPLGGEFRVNTTTAGDQSAPAVAVAPGGSFVVTWQSNGQDGSGLGVYAQRYDASGNALGGEFRVNTTTAGDQTHPSVATDAQGDFVITWASNGQDGSGFGVYAQRYNSAGNAQGGEFRVNTTTRNDQENPEVAMDAAGDFVVVWQSAWQDGIGWGIYGQQFNSAGNAVGGEFRVNSTIWWDQVDPAVAMSTAGNFVVTWSSWGQDGFNWGIDGQRFFASGAAEGGEFRVNVTTAGDQVSSTVAMNSVGDFLVGWQSQGQDGSGWGVYGRLYNGTTGMPVTGEFGLSSTTAGNQVHPSWAMDDHRDAVAVWSGNSVLDSSGVLMQQFQVNSGDDLSSDTYPVDGGSSTAAGPLPSGHTVVASTPQAVSAPTQAVAAPAPTAVVVQVTRPASTHQGPAADFLSAVLSGSGFVSLSSAALSLSPQITLTAQGPSVVEARPFTDTLAPVVLAVSGPAEAERAPADALFVAPDVGAPASPTQAPPLNYTEVFLAAWPAAEPARLAAAPRTETALWPRLCELSFRDVNWLEEPSTQAPASDEPPSAETRSGLSPTFVAGLAVIVAGSWNAEPPRGDGKARRPGLHPCP